MKSPAEIRAARVRDTVITRSEVKRARIVAGTEMTRNGRDTAAPAVGTGVLMTAGTRGMNAEARSTVGTQATDTATAAGPTGAKKKRGADARKMAVGDAGVVASWNHRVNGIKVELDRIHGEAEVAAVKATGRSRSSRQRRGKTR